MAAVEAARDGDFPDKPLSTPAPRWLIPGLLAVLMLVLALAQRPGERFADSRIELTVDPGRFLDRITSVWTSTGDLGHVSSAQFIGYLFPMGPFFAAMHSLGVPMWVANRLWLAIVLTVAAWGAVWLMDALYSRERGIAHLVAGALFGLNPYVITFLSRSSVVLLAYAALPWLLLVLHRGLRRPAGWGWPVVLALVLACAGGGVNAALIPWLLAPMIILAAYEVLVQDVRRGAVWSFFWRSTITCALANAWWLVPVAIQSRYGADFLSFIEQPTSIWATTSASESLRLLGYWITYLSFSSTGVNAVPTVSLGSTYQFNDVVVIDTFLVPAIALSCTWFIRRWRYAPFFGIAAVAMLLVMTAGFPTGKPLAKTLIDLYYQVPSFQFLRTTYKAAPMVALSIACLGGAIAAAALRAARARISAPPRVVTAAVTGVLAMILILWAEPMFTGQAIEDRLAYTLPSYWPRAVKTADASTPPDRRVMVLPGQGAASYRWGETADSVALALSPRSYLWRSAVRYAPPASSQLQVAVDDQIQQSRLVPGQLHALMRWLSVSTFLVSADGDARLSGETGPLELAETLSRQTTKRQRVAAYGPTVRTGPQPGRQGGTSVQPSVAVYRVPGRTPPIVQTAEPTGGTVLDGDADGIIELAAHGLLPRGRSLLYAGDLGRESIAGQVRDASTLVFTDTNRRQAVLGTTLRADRGALLGPEAPYPTELPHYDLFPQKGFAAQTIALSSGLRYLRTPVSVAFSLLPQYGPSALFDHRVDLPWIPSTAKLDDRWVQIGLSRPHPVRSIRVLPHSDRLGRTSKIAISVNGGGERDHKLHPGWNTLTINADRLSTLRLRILQLKGSFFQGVGGIDELRIPGVDAQPSLRLPTDLATATQGLDTSHNPIDVLLSRQTADFPGRAGGNLGEAQLQSQNNMVDQEIGMRRHVTLPAGRTFGVSGWAEASAAAPDQAFDALAGLPRAWSFGSSSRFEGRPVNRASSAFDGRSDTAWIGNSAESSLPWISWSGPRPETIRTFQIRPGGPQFTFPSRILLQAPGVAAQTVSVPRNGRVTLLRPMRAKRFRMTILARQRLSAFAGLAQGVAMAEIRIPHLHVPPIRRSGTFRTTCRAVRIRQGRQRAGAAVQGAIATMDAGLPLPLLPCPSSQISLPAGTSLLTTDAGGSFLPDRLALRSAAPRPVALPPGVNRVTSPGTGEHDSARNDIRLRPGGPAWLVFGESWSTGWAATCDGRDLGVPMRINGFANGWRIDGSCRNASVRFTPQSAADKSYVVSAVTVLMMGLVLLGLLSPAFTASAMGRRVLGRYEHRLPGWTGRIADPVRRWNAWQIGLAAIAIGVPTGYLLAWRVGAALALGTVLLALVGFSARRLLVVCAAFMAAVMTVYMLNQPPNIGGAAFGYAVSLIHAHEMSIAALACFTAACVLLTREHRRRRDDAVEGPLPPVAETNVPAPTTEPAVEEA